MAASIDNFSMLECNSTGKVVGRVTLLCVDGVAHAENKGKAATIIHMRRIIKALQIQ